MVEKDKFTVMVSSSVNGFEDQLLRIEAQFITLEYDVIMSMSGSMKVDPRLHNFDNCLKAVEECDLFFGIIRPDCGTGRDGSESITFQEFKHARECHKPCWYVIDNRIKTYKNLLKSLVLREHPDTKDEDLNKAITSFYDNTIRQRKNLPRVLDLFETKDLHQFDPLCFVMEDFVNHKGLPKEEITNNWMHYYDHELDIAKYIRTNFGDKVFIANVLKEF